MVGEHRARVAADVREVRGVLLERRDAPLEEVG